VQWGMEPMTTPISLGFTRRRCRLQERIDDGTATDQQGRRQQKRNKREDHGEALLFLRGHRAELVRFCAPRLRSMGSVAIH
jgi:hypothetical protein